MWFKIKEISTDLFHVVEPDHVSFYIMRSKNKALLIDSGLGISIDEFQLMLKNLGIKTFDVLATHFHCDHVGANHLAGKVYANEKEWEKYQRIHDEEQILAYFELLKNHKKWPSPILSKTVSFASKVECIGAGKLQLGDHELEALHTPGHTCGHMVYISHKYKCIFMGDLIYDGLLFINLPDSDFNSYLESLETIWSINQKLNFTLLPSHNTIPLSADYLPRTIEVFQNIRDEKIKGIEVPNNLIFNSSFQFNMNGIRVQITKGKV